MSFFGGDEIILELDSGEVNTLKIQISCYVDYILIFKIPLCDDSWMTLD